MEAEAKELEEEINVLERKLVFVAKDINSLPRSSLSDLQRCVLSWGTLRLRLSAAREKRLEKKKKKEEAEEGSLVPVQLLFMMSFASLSCAPPVSGSPLRGVWVSPVVYMYFGFVWELPETFSVPAWYVAIQAILPTFWRSRYIRRVFFSRMTVTRSSQSCRLFCPWIISAWKVSLSYQAVRPPRCHHGL